MHNSTVEIFKESLPLALTKYLTYLTLNRVAFSGFNCLVDVCFISQKLYSLLAHHFLL